MTLFWRRLALAATVGAAAVVSLTPSRAQADVLVARFAGGGLDDGQAAKRLLPRHVPGTCTAPDVNTWVGFAPGDPGPPREMPRHRKPSAARKNGTAEVMRVLTLREALKNPRALAALILMIGDVPGMPPVESPGWGHGLTGPPDHGLTAAPPVIVHFSSSPPTAPEPTALLSGLLGCGLTGAYVLARRRGAHARPLAA